MIAQRLIFPFNSLYKTNTDSFLFYYVWLLIYSKLIP